MTAWPVTSRITRHFALRAATIGLVVAFVWAWHVRSTGAFSPAAWLVLAGATVAFAMAGRTLCHFAQSAVPSLHGAVPEILTGFFFCNTLLFALTLATPFGIGANVVIVAVLTVVLRLAAGRRPIDRDDDGGAAYAGLACIALCGVVATIWVRDAQPIAHLEGESIVHTVWYDVFIHARVASAFAQAHGLASMSDIKMAGGVAPAYHFASYMLPAALNALADTRALDAFAAFHLPFGILLVGMAAYTMVAAWRPWLGVAAAVAVLSLPDAFQQGFAIRLMSFHFMSQVNLGMLYGIACAALAWLVMVEGCRHRSRGAVIAAFVLLALCLFYKAHLFVANALLLLLYPTIAFPRINKWLRVASFATFVAVFVAAVRVSQLSPTFPTLRLDASGIMEYLWILMDAAHPGSVRYFIDEYYFERRWPTVINAALAALFITVTSFGYWVVAAPLTLWRLRARGVRTTVAWLVGLAVVNYLAMSLLLALDDRGIGSPEELVNRPMAWAYFVLVAWTGAGVAWLVWTGRLARSVRIMVLGGIVCFGLGFVFHASDALQTYPVKPLYGTYAMFNAQPRCYAEAARYIRTHRRPSSVMQDSGLDHRLFATAIAETQAYAIESVFSGLKPALVERKARVRAIQATKDSDALSRFAVAAGIDFYLLRPDESSGWQPAFLASAAFECGGYRVFRFSPT